MASTNDFLVQLLAKLDTSSVNTEFEALKKRLVNDPVIQKVTLDTSMSKQAIRSMASEIHNELGKAFKATGIESFDITVKDVESILASAVKESNKLAKELDTASSKAQKFLAQFNNKSGGTLVNSKEFKAVQDAINGLGNTHTIDDLNKAMNTLETTYNNMVSNLRNGGKSLNPFINAINDMKNMDSTLKGIELDFQSLASKPKTVADAIKDLHTQQSKVNQYSQGTVEWAQEYGILQSKIVAVKNEIQNVAKAEKASNTDESNKVKYYQKIIDNNKTIYSLKNKLLTADVRQTEEIDKQITKLEKRNQYNYGQLNKKGLTDNSWEQIVNGSKDTLESQLRINSAKQEDITNTKAVAQAEKERIATLREQEALQKNVNKIQLSTDVTKLETDYKKFGMVSQEVETNLKELKSAHEAVINAKGTDRLASEIERYDVALDKAKFSLKELTTTQVSMSQRANQMHTMKDWMDKNTKATKLCGEQVKQLIAECETCDAVRFDGIKREFKGIQDTARTAGKLGLSFFDGIKEQVSKFTQWFGITSVISSGVRAIKDMVVNVKELDDSLLELSKVSDLSANGLAKITDEAYKLGETVGKTGRQVIDAVTEFKRAGYTLNDSMDMAEAALVMTNVAEGITDTADAAGTLISVLKGYNMAESQAMSIVDMLNSTSNQSPIGFDELAEGLERTAGTMAQSGTTIQETIGLITAGYAQLRNVEKVSTSLITLSARLRGVNEDGEEIDGLSAELEESFGKIGVAIEDADGNLRSIYQIAQDYAKVMPTLTSEQKQYYAELAAGKRNVTTWNAITQQFIDAEKATAQAVDSVGSASEENQKYLDSISGKVSQFNSAVEQLSSTIVDSDLVKFFVDLGTTGVKAVDGLINALTPLGTIGLIGGSILSKNGIG